MIQHIERKDRIEKENRKLYKYSSEATRLIHENNESSGAKKLEVQKRLNEVFDNPIERQNALNKANDAAELKKVREEEQKKRLRAYRRVGHRYDEQIFLIFDGAQELSQSALLSHIQLAFNLNTTGATELLKIWEDNHLISKCHWDRQSYEVGYVLSMDCLLEEDITYLSWLSANSKQLKQPTEKHQEYLDENQLPF